MTRADDLTARFATLRAKVAENFHPDAYEVVRVGDPVPDGIGGSIDPEPEVVETGRCRLQLSGRQGTENVQGVVVVATSPYTADLPIDSVVEETDTLRVNGREFEVISVGRGGGFDLFTAVGLEERSQ